MQAATAKLRAAGTARVYIIHGTFAGTDASGLGTEIGRRFPELRDGLARLSKRLVDAVMRDNGNYTPAFAQQLAEALRAAGRDSAPVTLFPWTGENHHLGRAHAAVRLVDELLHAKVPPGGRVLLWTHSHGGNVAALVTHLLAGPREAVAAFFDAARCYFRSPWKGAADLAVWNNVEQMLRDGPRPALGYPLDIATFGTPLRYAWCEAGCATLVHFVNHRAPTDAPPHRTKAPRGAIELLQASGGDYVQQFGIAGSNTPPAIWMWRAWSADRKLNALLQPNEFGATTLWARINSGIRTAESGRTLLVDYGPPRGGIEEHLAGHAVYTQAAWLPFHAEQFAEEQASQRQQRSMNNAD
ncbi:MAG: hypothetical protein C0483_04275 [Pirellula sp.]|nr:hypothetical protein [Pirellula sp.]